MKFLQKSVSSSQVEFLRKKSFLLSHVEFLQAVQFAGGFRSDGFEEEVSLSEKGLKVKWEARDIKYKYTMKYV